MHTAWTVEERRNETKVGVFYMNQMAQFNYGNFYSETSFKMAIR